MGALLRWVESEGFAVERISRCPYLDQCPECGIFELDDALLVLRVPAAE